MTRVFDTMIEEIESVRVAEQAVLADDPEAECIEGTALLMLFESPPPDSFASPAAGHELEHDELEGQAPG